MWVYDRSTRRFLKVNDAALRKYGYTREEFLSMTIKDIRSPKESERLERFITSGRHKFRPAGEWIHRTKNGRPIKVIITSEAIEYEGEKARLVQALDVTLERRLEAKQSQLSLLNEKLIENLPDVFFLIDQEGYVLQWNRNFERISGYTPEEIKQLRAEQFFSGQEKIKVLEALQKLKNGESVQIEARFNHKEGHQVPARFSATSFSAGGQRYITGISQDLRELHALQQKANEEKQRYRETHQLLDQTFESIGDAVFVIDSEERKILNVNRAAAELLHYRREELLGASTELAYPSLEYFHEVAEQIMPELNEKDLVKQDIHLKRKDGTLITGRVTMSKLKEDGDWKGKIVSAVRDVTEELRLKKELHQSQERLLDAQRIAHLGHWSRDLKNEQLYWSDEIFRIFGLEADTVISYERFLEGVHPEDRKMVDEYTQRLLEGGDMTQKHRVVRPDGEVRYVMERAEVENDTNGNPEWLVGTVQDITEQELHDRELELALRDKELMLAEVHHRVKNNMALVSALLYLQLETVEHPEAYHILESSQARIKSIAGVHEELYNSERFTHIPLTSILNRAINISSGLLDPAKIHIDESNININQAIPFALFLNELFFYLAQECRIELPDQIGELKMCKEQDLLCLTLSMTENACFYFLRHFYEQNDKHLVAHTLLQQLRGQMTLNEEEKALQLQFRLSDERGSSNAMRR